MNTHSKVLALINPQSGSKDSVADAIVGIREAWEGPDTDLKFQFTTSREDGHSKAKAAVEDGVDTVIVVGGDGTINAIGTALIGTPARLCVIPTGSGNGFARHFDIPLNSREAALELRQGKVQRIDVGKVNNVPFLVTMSCAWEVDITKHFEALPMRGILPYVLSAVYGVFTYVPQPFQLTVDDEPAVTFENPMLCTVANLTQYGGGFRIAPAAAPDDGLLELVVMERSGLAALLNQLPSLLADDSEVIPDLKTRSFRTLRIEREQPSAIQIDGELEEAEAVLSVEIIPNALNVVVPQSVPATTQHVE